MVIERATERDIQGINNLLRQVLEIHHKGRPDLFKSNAKKYTDAQLAEILKDDSRPIFAAKDSSGNVVGYAFCMFVEHKNDNIMQAVKSLYIDDLCVDEGARGMHIGKALFEYVKDFAEKEKCYNITLNVWGCNESAKRFYEKCGLKPQKICMETIL